MRGFVILLATGMPLAGLHAVLSFHHAFASTWIATFQPRGWQPAAVGCFGQPLGSSDERLLELVARLGDGMLLFGMLVAPLLIALILVALGPRARKLRHELHVAAWTSFTTISSVSACGLLSLEALLQQC